MKRRDIRQLLEDIKKCNDQLDLFTAKAETLDQAASPQFGGKRNKSTFNMPLQQVYNHAAHLHQVLSQAWACGVHASHRVHLLLEHRMVRKGRRKQQPRSSGGGDSEERDRGTFSLAFNGTEHSGTGTWYLAEVKVIDEPVFPPR
jgi:hypothetical protein